ncbi:MAG: lysophospholipid acyltransferase family protein [Rudaea sp.]
MTDRARVPWFHFVANRLLHIVAPILLKLDVEGMENVPQTGPVIAAFNHTSFLDSVLLAAYLRWDVLPMAKVELFKLPTGLIFYGYGAFPIRRGEGDLSALRRALGVLKENHVMLISPEGTRTKSGAMEPAREGAALIAIKSGAPILPIGIWGGKQLATNMSKLRRTKVGIRIGDPLTVVAAPAKPNRHVLRQVTDELMYYLARLVPAEYRGVYADAESIVPQFVFPEGRSLPNEEQPKQLEVVAMR